jgi:hypothetical protein
VLRLDTLCIVQIEDDLVFISRVQHAFIPVAVHVFFLAIVFAGSRNCRPNRNVFALLCPGFFRHEMSVLCLWDGSCGMKIGSIDSFVMRLTSTVVGAVAVISQD